MSTQSPFGRANAAFPTLPRGDVLGTYDTYPQAQAVVAKLAESDFPVKQLSIVGNDLKTVERVTGKLTYGRAAIAGALSGLWLGIFFGIVLTLFSQGASGGTVIAAAIIGAGFGMLYGVVSFSLTRRFRDFTSVHQVLATNYQIIVDPQLTGQAQRLLGGQAPTGWQPLPGQHGPGQGGPGQGGGQAPYGQGGPGYGGPVHGAPAQGGPAQGGHAQGGPAGRAPQYGERAPGSDGPRSDASGEHGAGQRGTDRGGQPPAPPA